MEIEVKIGEILKETSELAILGTLEGATLPAEVAGLLEPKDYQGKTGQTLLLYPRGVVAPKRLLLVGMGKAEKATSESIRRVSATAVKEAQNLQVADVTIAVHGELPLQSEEIGQAFAEGVEMGSYRFLRYRSELSETQKFKVKSITVFTKNDGKVDAGVHTGQIIGRGVNFARDLVNTTGEALYPETLADEAVALGKRLDLKVKVWDMAQLTKEGFGGILAVGKGSVREPRFIVMEYGEAKQGTPTICLVGKGLTFDSGGLNIKPPEAMETMKNDMGGSAAVFGVMQAAAELKLPLHIVALIASAENMPSGNSYRPGDVVKSLSGKTIEILNTDAEGRVILADALFYAQRYNPDAIIEVSTLTGAIIITLGAHAIGLFGTEQNLVDGLLAASEKSVERAWPFPMWEEYHQMVKSEIADLKNIAGRPAGSITSATFLAAFTGDYPFVHFDIAGTAWTDRASKPYESQGGTGSGVRVITQFLRDYQTERKSK